jgi:glycerophosphoryl diester phosphodiesterase
LSKNQWYILVSYAIILLGNRWTTVKKTSEGRGSMKTLVWAHRGASSDAPENTLEAFSLALEQEADGIELDVHMTADGEIVVAHDETLERVSNGTGLIKDRTLSELKQLDFSKAFSNYSPARIPTLAEVYDFIKPTGLTVNVEIKSGIVQYEGIEKKLIDLAEQFCISDRIIYSSFNHYSLMILREISPSAKIGLLYNEALIDPHLYAQHVGANAIHPFFPTLMVPGVLKGCREAGVAIHPWTVNDINHMKNLIAAGVDALITDVPKAARQVLMEVEANEAQ